MLGCEIWTESATLQSLQGMISRQSNLRMHMTAYRCFVQIMKSVLQDWPLDTRALLLWPFELIWHG